MSNLPENIKDRFFAPVEPGLLNQLIKTRNAELERLGQINHVLSSDEYKNSLSRFFERDHIPRELKVDYQQAVKRMDSSYWSQAMKFTDVFDAMPQKRRDEWHDDLHELRMPPFTEEHVFPTFEQLLMDRSRYLAERVDGIFKSLSGDHVTNSPAGFRKRMIIADVHDGFMSCWRRCGVISDLRKIISKFMGQDEPRFCDTGRVIGSMMACTGEWHELDGGSLRARLYKKGTIHLEVHPDIACQLNQILAFLYPGALPPTSLKRPKKPAKEFSHLKVMLDGKVLSYLSECKINGLYQLDLPFRALDNALEKRAYDVLKSIGGVVEKYTERGLSFHSREMERERFVFDYKFADAYRHIVFNGCLPDKVSYQYYPTPEELAEKAIEWADIKPVHAVLEPSAGQGAIADCLPEGCIIQCCEISELHCTILESKGFSVTNEDFLKVDPKPCYDRIVMNPPFSEGRARAHVEHAYQFLRPGGVMVAILPAGLRNKGIVQGSEWSEVLDNQFKDASVSVVMMRATR